MTTVTCPRCLEDFDLDNKWQAMPVQCPHCGAESHIQYDEDDEYNLVVYLELVEANNYE
ncbi:MAG: hypothetical protein H6658_02140 [Ardenticatenaceae bacterium]|nr:hypothetical protein [Ardenticatenaceae bacterium]